MSRLSLLLPALALLALPVLPTTAAEPSLPWTTLSLGTCGVDTFAAAHPEADGRGVVIAVLDCGVEIEAPGLQKTPTGERKVIDVQDFSGEGDFTWVRAEPGDDALSVIIRDKSDRPVVCQLPTDPPLAPRGEWHYTWFEESRFVDSDLEDFDDDGASDTRVPILIYPAVIEGEATYVSRFDFNQDRDFSNDPALADYRLRHDFVFPHRAHPEAQRRQISIAVNHFPADHRLSVYFDDGGHGTHVAGIAAGYQLGGQPALNGVAPGASVIGLKIGNNRLAGGSTTPGSKLEAFRYAARYAREHNVPVVCNLSYGIDSEREGMQEIDTALEALLRANPLLTVCTSAGNSGPGLSTVGTPAAAPSAISVAALLPLETAREGRGQPLPAHAIALFSSRGGEALKPDVCTPGYATSSVPLWNRGGDFWQGTSMASPYAAGLCARLISVALAGGLSQPTRDSVKRALMAGSTPLEGYTPLDYGAGIPNLENCHAALVGLIGHQRSDDPSALEVATNSPMGDGTSQTALFRGIALPREPQVFTITPHFASTTDTLTRDSFNRRYTVSSDSPWATPVQQTVYLRPDLSAEVAVRYDTLQLRTPGLYVADIALREEGGTPGGYPDAVLRSVFVVPDRFEASRTTTVQWADQTAGPSWRPTRHFLYVPPYASAVRFTLELPAGHAYGISLRSLFVQDGQSRWSPLRIDRASTLTRATWIWNDGLESGVIELPMVENDGETGGTYTLTAELFAFESEPAHLEPTGARDGRGPSLPFTVTNALETPYFVNGEATIDAHRMTDTAEFGGEGHTSIYTRSLKLDERYAGVRARVVFDRDGYLPFTDIPFGIYDSGGRALAREGVGAHEGTIQWERPGRGDQTVEFRLEPAFTDHWALADVEARIELDLLLADPLTGEVTVAHSGASTIPLPPGIGVDLEASFADAPPPAPKDSTLAGSVTFTERDSGDVVLVVPIGE